MGGFFAEGTPMLDDSHCAKYTFRKVCHPYIRIACIAVDMCGQKHVLPETRPTMKNSLWGYSMENFPLWLYVRCRATTHATNQHADEANALAVAPSSDTAPPTVSGAWPPRRGVFGALWARKAIEFCSERRMPCVRSSFSASFFRNWRCRSDRSSDADVAVAVACDDGGARLHKHHREYSGRHNTLNTLVTHGD